MGKKVWIFNQYAYPPKYATNIRHFKFAEKLIERGYEVKIFSSSTLHRSEKNLIDKNVSYERKKYNGVEFIFLKTVSYFGNGLKRAYNMIEFSFKLYRKIDKIEKNRPDVIYASSPNPLVWLSAYLIAKSHHCKLIAESRDLWPETLISMGKISSKNILAKILYKFEAFIYKKSDNIIFTMPGGKKYIADKGINLSYSKVYSINNGVDLKKFHYNSNNYKVEESKLFDEDKFKVVYAGSMGQANNVGTIVKVAKLLKKRGCEDIIFILYGDGYQKESLEEYVKKHQLNKVYFKGRVEKKYIPFILNKSNLNVFVGKSIDLYKYGLSLNKMFEYFASGKPVISNIDAGDYDIVEKYECGLTVKSGSAKKLADGILSFYNMPKNEYEKYCNNALKAAKDFDFKVLTDKLEKVINK